MDRSGDVLQTAREAIGSGGRDMRTVGRNAFERLWMRWDDVTQGRRSSPASGLMTLQGEDVINGSAVRNAAENPGS